LAAAAINEDADTDDNAAVGPDDIDCFLDPSAAGDHVFGHDEALARPNLETTPQDQTAGVFLRENVPFAQGAADLLANNDSAEGGGDDNVALNLPQLIGKMSANLRGYVGVLKQQGALKKLAAVKTGPQNEVAVQQRAGLAEEREQIVAHLGSAGCQPVLFGSLPKNCSVIRDLLRENVVGKLPTTAGWQPALFRNARNWCGRDIAD
jgi:hypothetical protein